MSVPSAWDRANTALLDACEELRALLAKATRDEVASRYKAGSLLCVLRRAPGTYGNHAVERVAAELGIAAPTLYRYVSVAESWSADELGAQSARVGRFGAPLSWSHFVALTRAPDATARRLFADECLAKGWSVRELTHVIAERLDRSPATSDAALADESVRVALTEGIESAARATVEMNVFAEALAERLSELDDEADEALVARAITAYQELNDRAESTLDQLRGASRVSEKRLRCAAPVRVPPSPSSGVSVTDDEADEPHTVPLPRLARVERARVGRR